MSKISKFKIILRKNRVLVLIVHYFVKTISIAFFFEKIRNKGKEKTICKEDVRNILILRLDGLGDLVMSTPSFAAIREYFPASNICLLAGSWSRELVEAMPFFDKISYFDAPWFVKGKKGWFMSLTRELKRIRWDGYDLAIDLRGDFRNNIFMYLCGIKYRVGYDITGCDSLLTHVIPIGSRHHARDMNLALLNLFGINEKREPDLKICLGEENRAAVDNFFIRTSVEMGTPPIVVIHPGAKWDGRHWVPDRFSSIGDRLIEKFRAKVILAGGPNDLPLAREIKAAMKQRAEIFDGNSIVDFCALLERAHVFIGVDSGPMHIATAMGIKVVALFGPGDPDAVGPYGGDYVVVTRRDEFSCSPCSQKQCKRLDGNCMSAIEIEDVWSAVEKQMEKIINGI